MRQKKKGLPEKDAPLPGRPLHQLDHHSPSMKDLASTALPSLQILSRS